MRFAILAALVACSAQERPGPADAGAEAQAPKAPPRASQEPPNRDPCAAGGLPCRPYDRFRDLPDPQP